MEIDTGDLNHNNHHHDSANPDHVMVYVNQPDPKPQNNATVPPAKTKTLRRLALSKPKARFAESGETVQLLNPVSSDDDNRSLSSDGDDDEEWFKDENDAEGAAEQTSFLRSRRRKTKHKRVVIEFVLFIIILVCLICSLTVKSLKNQILWGLEVWKWCLIVMVLFSGRLVSVWLVGVLVFFIERNFMLREKVLYFVYGLRRSFQNCVWLALVLFCWMIMFRDVHKRNHVARIIFLGLVAVLVGATIWLLKIVLVKVLASSFHVTTFFDRMKESVFNHYILETLSGPPLEEEEEVVEVKPMVSGRPAGAGRRMRKAKTMPSRMALERSESKRKIDMERLRKLSRHRRPTAWTVKRLVNYVKSSGLSTISRTVDNFTAAEEGINSEWEARMAAQRIFKNVAKPGAKYIEEEDLLRFLKSDEVFTVFPLFEGALETGRITKSSLRNWVFQAYVERKALAHSLNDTKTAVQQLHRLASAVVSILIVVVSLLIMGLATINIVFFITTQMLVVGFVFQNSCKTVFECIIFVFVMHPFDVGDRCVIDGVQMIVEEMNILSTVFLRYDMEKIYYPNSVLTTKPISNFRRSPDMGDSVEFTIDVSTPTDDINALKKAIQWYVESKPKYWVPKHSVLFKEIENMDKMKMILCVQHTMNHQNFGEKSARRSELVLELKKIFENHGIKYHLLPQQVHLTQLNSNPID